MALLRAQACHLEPRSPAPRWSFREPCRCSLCGAEVPLWMCECPKPGSWLASCFLPKLFRLLPSSLSRLSILHLSSTSSPTSHILRISFDSPHTHWTRQRILFPFALFAEILPKPGASSFRGRILGERCRLCHLAWPGSSGLHVVCPDSTSFSPLSSLFTPQGWAYLVAWHRESCQLWGVKLGLSLCSTVAWAGDLPLCFQL